MIWAVLAVILAAQLPQSPDDVSRGKRLYEGHCAICHGQTGTGSNGPSLAKPTLVRASDDASLVRIIANGIPGTEMPGAWQMTDRERNQVAAYVRSLGRVAVEKLPGDAARGKAIYEGKGGCNACHIVRGKGASLGPELTEVGARRSAARLRQALVDPGSALPEDFTMVRAVTTGGGEVRGVRVNEDSFTIQIRDTDGRLHSLRKRSIKTLERLANQSPMPSFGKSLSAAELDDLVAYLASLRGKS